MIAKNRTPSKPDQKELCQLGQRIEALAKKRGFGRDQLAEAAGITYVALWSIMVGRRKPRRETATNIAAALGVGMGELFDDYIEPKSGCPSRIKLCPLGKNIEELAATRGLNRHQLAIAAGVSDSGLWSVLVGRTIPSLTTALKISKALAVPVDRLVG
jgi:transcriptional regulator with XRE-family HTH domain